MSFKDFYEFRRQRSEEFRQRLQDPYCRIEMYRKLQMSETNPPWLQIPDYVQLLN